MAKTKVKQDSHGLYVRAGGYVIRPWPCKYNSSGANPIYRRDGTSAFHVGSEVNAHHQGGSTTGVIKANDIVEYWFTHDSYYGGAGKIKSSEDCWDPGNDPLPK